MHVVVLNGWEHLTHDEYVSSAQQTVAEFLSEHDLHGAPIWDRNGPSLAFDGADFERFKTLVDAGVVEDRFGFQPRF